MGNLQAVKPLIIQLSVYLHQHPPKQTLNFRIPKKLKLVPVEGHFRPWYYVITSHTVCLPPRGNGAVNHYQTPEQTRWWQQEFAFTFLCKSWLLLLSETWGKVSREWLLQLGDNLLSFYGLPVFIQNSGCYRIQLLKLSAAAAGRSLSPDEDRQEEV